LIGKETVTSKTSKPPKPVKPNQANSKASSKFVPQAISQALRKPPKLVSLAAALLLGGGAIAYLNFAQRAPRSISPAGTQLVPQTALGTMTVTTDELTWTKLRQFGTPETQQQLDSFLQAWKDRLFTANGYSYKRDIKPWIGDRVTLAFLSDPDAAEDPALGGGLESATQNMVMVIPIADPLKAKSLLEASPQNSNITWQERNYKGITVNSLQTKLPEPKAPAATPDPQAKAPTPASTLASTPALTSAPTPSQAPAQGTSPSPTPKAASDTEKPANTDPANANSANTDPANKAAGTDNSASTATTQPATGNAIAAKPVPKADSPAAPNAATPAPNPANGQVSVTPGATAAPTEAAIPLALESAVVGNNWLLLSNSKAGIEQAIDTYRGGRSLMDLTGYRKAATRPQASQPPGKNFAQLYLNLPATSKLLEPPDNSDRGSLVPLQGSQGIIATALIEPEGVRFIGTSWLFPKNDLMYRKLSNDAGEMPRRLPDDTLVMMSGSNLKEFWQGFSESNISPPFFPDPQNLKAGLLTQTGLDLDQDIMPWAAGEFALGMFPPVSAKAGGPGEGQEGQGEGQGEAGDSGNAAIQSAPLMLMVQTNDRKLAESVWAQLDDVMASRYRYQVKAKETKSGSITEWISPFQGIQFSHGWLPGNVTFFAVGQGAAESIPSEGFAITPKKSLAENRLFQTLTTQAPSPNNGHFFVDLTKINDLEGTVFPLPQLSTEGPVPIEAIGLTTTVSDRTMDYDLYVDLAKGNKPDPL
jgi:hypothetical protein